MGRYEKAETGHFVRKWIISALLQQHNHQAGLSVLSKTS